MERARRLGCRWGILARVETVAESDIRPLRRAEYDALVGMGLLGEDEPIELLEGQLVAREPEGEPHAAMQRLLLRLFFDALPATEAEIGAGNPFAATETSEPEPDVALFPPGTYRGSHPTTATLLIEVAHTSRRRDLVLKARIYAQSGVGEYWVVDLANDEVVVHRRPTRTGYTDVTRHREGVLRPLRHPQVGVDLRALFA